MRRVTRWCPLLLLLLGLAGGWPAAAGAQEARGWYLTTGLGLNHVDQEGSLDPKADLGFRVVAAGGFRFDPRWSLELDTGFIRNTRPDHPSRGPQDPISQVPLVVNGLFHFANPSRFEPFVGAGFGVTVVHANEDTGGDATLGFKGGVLGRIGDRVAIGLDYTFFMMGFTSALIGEPVGDDTVNLALRWSL